MKLKALDQIHISAVKADSLRRGEEFAVSEALGAELLSRHPSKFEKVSDDMPDEKPAPAPVSAKADKPHPNKAADKPHNKGKAAG